MARARKYGLQIQSADLLARLAREDRSQAKAATLPSLSALNQFIYTEGNGTPSGVFVANDGVHVYNEQAVVHEELLALARRGEVRLAAAAEAVARARVDVAARGLNATVVQNYYSIASAERKALNSERSLTEAQKFFDITRKQEAGGEVAHSDVIKAQLQVQQRQREVQDAELSILKTKIALGLLIFPTLETDYDIVDDLANLPLLPSLEEVTAKANATSPDLQAAKLSTRQARLGVSVARYAYLPSLSLDFFYGINANQLAAHTDYFTQASGRSTLPKLPRPISPESRLFRSGHFERSHLELGFHPQQGQTGCLSSPAGGSRLALYPAQYSGPARFQLWRSQNRFVPGAILTLLGRALGRKSASYPAALPSRRSHRSGSRGCAIHRQPRA